MEAARPPGAAFLSDIHSVQVHGGNFSVAGRDVHHHHTYYHGARTFIQSVLKSIPNFRRIHIATLGRATPGTGEWIFAWETYLLWLDTDGFLKILWGSGMPGAGKTILASIVINALEVRAKASTTPICVCYLYIRYNDHSKATVQAFLETLVKQTVERHPSCLSVAEEVYAQHIQEETLPSEGELLDLLHRFTKLVAGTFYILDALDEAPTRIQLDLLKKLASLNVKLFITSRPLKSIEAHFPGANCFPIFARDHDLGLHIAQEVSRSPDLSHLLVDATWREEVISSIKQKCGGMFLHASLQLEALQDCTSVHDVKRTLDGFPEAIDDVYLQTWRRILDNPPQKAHLAKTVLVWVLYSLCPLTTSQLQRAVATCPKTYRFQPERIAQEATLISLCHGLVIVEENKFVRLVHYTAQAILQRLILETFPHPHSLLANVCMTRLADCGFQQTSISSAMGLEVALQADPLLSYAYENWAFVARLSLFLDAPLTTKPLMEFVAGCEAFPVCLGFTQMFDILQPFHVIAFFDLPITLASQDSLPFDPNIPTPHERLSPLSLACTRGALSAIQQVLEQPGVLVNKGDRDGWTPLMWATRYGSLDIVELLLSNPDVDINAVERFGKTALILASRDGHDEIAGLLLAHPRVDVNAADQFGMSPLRAALAGGHLEIVSLLLAHPDSKVGSTAKGNRPPEANAGQ